jgi:hypothetical protein
MSYDYNVIDVGMDRHRVQNQAAVSLRLLVGRKWINHSFRLSWTFVISLLICLRSVSGVSLRKRVLRVSVVGKASAARRAASARSILRVGASPVVPMILGCGVPEPKSATRGPTLATAERRSYYTKGSTKRCCWPVATAVAHYSSLAASDSTSTTASACAAAPGAFTTASADAAAATTTNAVAPTVTDAAGTAAAAATPAAVSPTATAAVTPAAGTAATAATATMGPDRIRKDYRDREGQQEDQGGFHSMELGLLPDGASVGEGIEKLAALDGDFWCSRLLHWKSTSSQNSRNQERTSGQIAGLELQRSFILKSHWAFKGSSDAQPFESNSIFEPSWCFHLMQKSTAWTSREFWAFIVWGVKQLARFAFPAHPDLSLGKWLKKKVRALKSVYHITSSCW